MQWEPDDKAWQAYIKLEQRYEEFDRASAIYERWVAVRPEPRVWVKWGKFEEERGMLDKAREVFQTALEFFGDDEEQIEKAQAVFNAFAKMETRLKEYERARVIYKVRPPTFIAIGVRYKQTFRLPCSLLCHAYPVQSPLLYTQHTLNSKSNTAHEARLNRQCSENGVYSTRRNSSMMAETTMCGSITRAWRRVRYGTCGRRA